MKQKKIKANNFKIDFDDLNKNFQNTFKTETSEQTPLVSAITTPEEQTQRDQLLKEEYEIKVSEIINGKVISNNDITFIPLENINSSICYFISAIQRLHSSKTLNEAIKNCDLKHLIKNENVAQDVEATLNSLKHYANINDDNISKIFELITNDHKILFESVFNQHMFNGGDPYRILIWLMFPLLYMEFGIQIVKQIIVETNFDTNRFSGVNVRDGILSIIENGFNRLEPFYRRENTNKFLRDANKCFISELNDYVSNINQRERPTNFIVGNMNLFFNDEEGEPSKFPGHAVVVIKSKDNKFMVIDDAVNVREITNYIQQCGKRISKLEFKDIDDENIKELKKLLSPCTVDARIYRTIIKFGNEQSFLGGFVEDDTLIPSGEESKDSPILTDGKIVYNNPEDSTNSSEHEESYDFKNFKIIYNNEDSEGETSTTSDHTNQTEALPKNKEDLEKMIKEIITEQNLKVSDEKQTSNISDNVRVLSPSNNNQNSGVLQSQDNRDVLQSQDVNMSSESYEINNISTSESNKQINSFKDLYVATTGAIWVNRSFIEKCLIIMILILNITIITVVVINVVKCKKTDKKIKEYQDKLKKVDTELKATREIYESYTKISDIDETVPKFSTQGLNARLNDEGLQQLKPKINTFINEYGAEILKDVDKFTSQNKPMNLLDLRHSEVLNKVMSKKTNYVGTRTNEIVDFSKKPFEVSNDFIY